HHSSVYPSRSPLFSLPLCLPLHLSLPLQALHPFPTRRSSDLNPRTPSAKPSPRSSCSQFCLTMAGGPFSLSACCRHFWFFGSTKDRKSTRLNSSHQIISYAVFCLKKKKIEHHAALTQRRPQSR